MGISHRGTEAQRSDLLEELQDWYFAQCDGDWEHQQGVSIQTLDNPGWLVRIDLAGTPLLKKEFKEKSIKDSRSREHWIECRKESGQFVGASGPMMLSEIFKTFIDWTKA